MRPPNTRKIALAILCQQRTAIRALRLLLNEKLPVELKLERILSLANAPWLSLKNMSAYSSEDQLLIIQHYLYDALAPNLQRAFLVLMLPRAERETIKDATKLTAAFLESLTAQERKILRMQKRLGARAATLTTHFAHWDRVMEEEQNKQRDLWARFRVDTQTLLLQM